MLYVRRSSAGTGTATDTNRPVTRPSVVAAQDASSGRPEAGLEGKTRGEGGELRLIQWQAPTQLIPHVSTGDKDYLAAERQASAAGLALLGFYHSHPDHPAEPSQYDLDHAWPTFVYPIVSIRGGQPEATGTSRRQEIHALA